ncbi:hypothetical protein BDZ97DRAFT_1786283 [Flammula alnicola]|nr:hypothetical protein BDZ97DRAFT_1786283 [Flammula alnicola]
MTDQPSLFVFNVSKAGCRHISEVPDDARFLLPSFNNALNSAREKNYIVQGAMYGPAGATVFIDTDDEDWADHVDCYGSYSVPEDVKKKISMDAHVAEIAPVQTIDQPSTSTEPTGQAYVSIFKVGNPSYKCVSEGANEPQVLLKSFIDAIQSILDKNGFVQGAMYGAEEGANIFIRGPDVD